jgi:hypothetical protein
LCVCVRARSETGLSVVSGSGVGRLVRTFIARVTTLTDGLLVDIRERSRVPSMRTCRPLFRRSGSPGLATIETIIIRTESLATNRDGLVSRRGVEAGVLTIVRSVVGIVRSVTGLAGYEGPLFGPRF